MIKEKLTKILIDEFEIEPERITLDSKIQSDLGIDSLDVVDMVVLIQNEFGIKLQSQDFKDVKTFGDLIKLLEEKK
ncbi:MAG: acyl carrier protein [Paludibacteraceae bacterium]|nr:acyl carrier protein [Paludibacteraceae bacterium]MBR6686055.1 acyl carrier protein [Paludibacteraceae bacterium]